MSDEESLDLLQEIDGIDLIQKTPIFAKLGFDETHRLGEIVRLQRVPRGTVVIEQDSLSEALFIIRSGEVTVYRRDSKGERDRLGRLVAGEIFGEMSLVDDLLVSADVEVSSEEAELLVIPRGEFDRLLETDARFAAKVYKSFCRTLSSRLRKLNEAFVELHKEPTRG